MFQIKDFASISASILNYAKAVQDKITDFSVGSVARTMFEAPAIEIEELYQQMFIGLKESIPVAIYNSFEFSKTPALESTGIVRVTITPATTNIFIAAGAIFTSPAYSVAFESLNDTTIVAGNSYVDIKVKARVAGAIGNVASGTAFAIQPAINGIVSAVALARFTTGRDIETDPQRKSRFSDYILTLNHGTVASIYYGLSLVNIKDANDNIIESVRVKSVVEPYKADPLQPISLVNCYVHNGVDGASGALLAETLKVIEGYKKDDGTIVTGWKAAWVHVVIYAATNSTINVTATTTIAAGYVSADVKAAVQSAISDYITALEIGVDVLNAEIIAAAMGVPGVVNFEMTVPAADTVVLSTAKAIPGTFTI